MTSSREPADSVSDSESESDDGEGDREGPRDPLPPGVDPSTTSTVGDGERDRIWASGGARTTGAGGICGVTGHRESEACLGDGRWERDGGNADVLRHDDVGASCSET